MLKAFLWLIPVLRRPKNKYNLGSYFCDHTSPQDPPHFSDKHPHLVIYGRYWKIFQIKFVAKSICNISSYVQNFAQITPPSPISQIVRQEYDRMLANFDVKYK